MLGSQRAVLMPKLPVPAGSIVAVGSFVEVTALPFSFTTQNVGDLVVLSIGNTGTNTVPSVTSVSSNNITWQRITGEGGGYSNNASSDLWYGIVHSVGADTVSASLISGAAIHDGGCQEFSAGQNVSWSVVTSGVTNATGSTAQLTYPSLSTMNGELYVGWALVGGAAGTSGTPSGFTWIQTSIHGNGYIYNLNTPSTVETPSTSDNDVYVTTAAVFLARH